MIRMTGKLYFRPMPDNELFNGTYSVQEQFDFKNMEVGTGPEQGLYHLASIPDR